MERGRLSVEVGAEQGAEVEVEAVVEVGDVEVVSWWRNVTELGRVEGVGESLGRWRVRRPRAVGEGGVWIGLHPPDLSCMGPVGVWGTNLRLECRRAIWKDSLRWKGNRGTHLSSPVPGSERRRGTEVVPLVALDPTVGVALSVPVLTSPSD